MVIAQATLLLFIHFTVVRLENYHMESDINERQLKVQS